MVSIAAAPIAANQFFQGLMRPPDSVMQSGGYHRRQLSSDARAATQRLLDIMGDLCAPDSGWPADTPQTPDNLLPYVSEEAEELLEVLHRDEAHDREARTPLPPTLIADLSAFWLWAIAASSPAAMQLLEGVSTPVPTQSETYGVRLVPVLHMQLDQTAYALDLTTQTHFESPLVLPESAVVSWPDMPLGEPSLSQLQQTIWAQAIALAPGLRPWQQGLDVEILLPGHTWATATAALRFQFVPLTIAVATADDLHAFDWDATDPGEGITPGMPTARVWSAEADGTAPFIDTQVILAAEANAYDPAISLEADVTFVDGAAWQRAIAPLAIEHVSFPGATPSPLTTLDLVQALFPILQPDQGTKIAELQWPCSLADFCQQIKWLWIRASHDLMPLMSGVAVRRLIPGDTWDMGTLVTLGQLVIQSPDQPLARLDVSTGDWQPDAPSLTAQDVIHLQALTPFAQDLWSSQALTDHCAHLIRQRSPLLAYLMNPVAIDLTTPQDALFPDARPQGLTLQFQLNLDFVP